MYISTNLVDLFGMLFSVNILTYTVKGFKPSYPKIVYCILLLSIFSLCFYFGATSILPRRGNFSMKTFSLWIMLSMQLLSPVLTLTVELLGLKKSAVGANIIVQVHNLVCSLGYQGCFGLAEKHKIKTQIFILIFCFTIILYLLIMLYPYDSLCLTNSPILIRGTICVLFDVINQIHQTNFLRSMQLYSIFLKKTIKSSRFWSLGDTTKVKKLETIRATQSLLSKALVLFNSKYYVSLLLLSIKTIVGVASVFSDFLVEKIFLSFVLPTPDEERTIENSSYVDMVWSTYQLIFLFYTCHVHSSITVEVSNVCEVFLSSRNSVTSPFNTMLKRPSTLIINNNLVCTYINCWMRINQF